MGWGLRLLLWPLGPIGLACTYTCPPPRYKLGSPGCLDLGGEDTCVVRVCMGWDAEGRGGGVNDLPHICTDKDYAMHKYNHMVIARHALSDIIICTGIPTSITLSCDLYCRSQPNRQFSPKLLLKQPCRLP